MMRGCVCAARLRQVKGVDEFSDLAVVQVALQRGDTLPGTPLGDSDEMQVYKSQRVHNIHSHEGAVLSAMLRRCPRSTFESN